MSDSKEELPINLIPAHNFLSPQQQIDLLGKAKLVQSVEERNHSLIVAPTQPVFKHPMTNSTPLPSHYATLDRAEQQVFAEIMTLMTHINELSREQEQEQKRLEQAQKRIQELNQQGHSNQQLGHQAQREAHLTISEAQIKAVKGETAQFIRQRRAIQGGEDYNQLLSQSTQQQCSLVQQLNDLNSRLTLTRQRDELRAQVAQLEEQKLTQKARDQEAVRQCVNDRIKMQRFLAEQELEKGPFMEALLQFKESYLRAKRTHQQLVSALSERGQQ